MYDLTLIRSIPSPGLDLPICLFSGSYFVSITTLMIVTLEIINKLTNYT